MKVIRQFVIVLCNINTSLNFTSYAGKSHSMRKSN